VQGIGTVDVPSVLEELLNNVGSGDPPGIVKSSCMPAVLWGIRGRAMGQEPCQEVLVIEDNTRYSHIAC
jgi:hypothetical protein